MEEWNQAKLQSYIDNFIEESLTLEYKSAGSLGMSDGKKTEITKDVSAMANSAGGIIIYGLKEYDQKDRKHLPEIIAPIDRTQYSKEWLEQIINNVRPHITGVIIHPISLSTGANDVAYAVEIPQSNTAHQATDNRYYRRYNFQSIAMADHEIRDVMNRVIVPNADVEFRCKLSMSAGNDRTYSLRPIIKNLGTQVINNFRLVFVFPRAGQGSSTVNPRENVVRTNNEKGDTIISYQSRGVLFPLEERDIGEEIYWTYSSSPSRLRGLASLESQGESVSIAWTLYADNMTPKQGTATLLNLHDFK